MQASWIFADRAEAGRRLAAEVSGRGYRNPVILALPRGGVPVGLELAKTLGAPLDLLLVRKIGIPDQPELAAGAVVDGDCPQLVLNEEVVALSGMTRDEIEVARQRALAEIARRRERYLAGRPPLDVSGRTAIVVDDGIATGATVRAGLAALRNRGAAQLVLAVPVAPRDTIARLTPELDDIVCLATPEPFLAIGYFYRDFHQISDDEVVSALQAAVRYGQADTTGRQAGAD